MARGPRNLRVAFDGVGLTQFGGVTLIEQFFQRLRLQRAFSRHIRFVQRNNRYSISESLEALLYPLVLGLGRIETTEPLRHNGVFQYLAGLPAYPAASSLRRFLERFVHSGRNAFLKLHDRWRTEMLGHQCQVIFDLDSTVLTVYGHQERAEETGFDALFLSALCDPEQGLGVGCKVLRKEFDAMAGDTTRALLAWNGGGNPSYAAQVLARRPHYL